MFRILYLFVAAMCSTALAVNTEEVESAPAESTTTTVWVGDPFISESLTADQHDSEVSIPAVPRLPNGITLAPSTTEITTTTTTLPEWTGDIPEEYGEGTGCSREEASIIARAMWDVGASDESVRWMLYVISRESTCDSAAHNGDRSTGDDSWGLCQQNNLSGWFSTGQLLEDYDRFTFADDFALNAESCAVMWAKCGRGPWTKGDYGCSTPAELR